MKKLIIFGSGHSAKRFVQANVEVSDINITLAKVVKHQKNTDLLANAFGLQTIKYEQILSNPNMFDIYIFSVTPPVMLKFLIELLEAGLKKPIIFEKPLAYQTKDVSKINFLLKRDKIPFGVMYNRRFDPIFLSSLFQMADEYIWEVAVHQERLANVLYDYVPHLLDYTFFLESSYDFQIEDTCQNSKETIFSGKLNNKKVILHFYYNDKNAPIYQLNGELLPSPDFMITHHKIISQLLSNQIMEDEIIRSAYSIAQVIEYTKETYVEKFDFT